MTINQKHKPGIYFGIYCMLMCVINPFVFPGSALNKYNIWGIIIASLIGGTISGFMFGWIWKLFKTQKVKSL